MGTQRAMTTLTRWEIRSIGMLKIDENGDTWIKSGKVTFQVIPSEPVGGEEMGSIAIVLGDTVIAKSDVLYMSCILGIDYDLQRNFGMEEYRDSED